MLDRAGQLAKCDGGYALRALRKKKKRNPEKEKPRSENKKTPLKKIAHSWRHRANNGAILLVFEVAQ
jgi:hypothetical protein